MQKCCDISRYVQTVVTGNVQFVMFFNLADYPDDIFIFSISYSVVAANRNQFSFDISQQPK